MIARLDDATIERARGAQSLVGLVAKRVKLRRSGRDWAGLCPFHQEKTASFTVSDAKGFYHCFGCGAHGSAIDWMIEAEGLDFRGAVAALLGGELPDARKPMQPAQRERVPLAEALVVPSATAGRWIFRTSSPARGDLVERWLEARECEPRFEPLPGIFAIDQLRFHPRCPWSVWKVGEEPEDHWLTRPAMIVPIADPEGAVWGVHVTYLSPDGRSKAALPRTRDGKERDARKIFGRLRGTVDPDRQPASRAVHCAAFLTPPETMCATAPLVAGEGFETTWSFAQGLGRHCRAVATLTLQNLQGYPETLRDGSVPLWSIKLSDRQPFTLPDAGEVIVAVDADMKPLRNQKVQLARGAKPVRADIGGLQRAEICAALAAQAWRRAGATSVRAVRPRMGADFNDEIRRVA